MRILISFALAFLAFTADANNVTEQDGISLSDTQFPWHLVIDRGKIQGCIYDNKYYSVGSILIEETLPRKCDLNSSREGIWSELNDAELVLYKESVKEQQALELESVNIGPDPISKEEARLLRYMRRVYQRLGQQE